MGELHLEIIVDRLLREFKVDATVGKPQVAYRETIRKVSEAEGRFVRQTGGHGQFGVVDLRIEPLGKGSGFEFVDGTKGGSIPRQFIRPVEDGIKEAMENGVLAGYPMVDIKATLLDGKHHEVDSSELAFQDRGLDGIQGSMQQGCAIAPRAGDGSRSGHAAGVHGRRHRRPEFAPRQDPEHGRPRRRAGYRGAGAAGDHVRLCDQAAVCKPGRATYTMQFAAYEGCRSRFLKK